MTWPLRICLVFIGSCTLIAAVVAPATTDAAFTGTTISDTSTATAATLDPPSDLHVSFHCQLLGILLPVADVTWTATGSTWAEGYTLERFVGSTLVDTASVVNAATAAITNGISLPHLSLSTTYTWHIRAHYNSWTSSDATVSATTPALCL